MSYATDDDRLVAEEQARCGRCHQVIRGDGECGYCGCLSGARAQKPKPVADLELHECAECHRPFAEAGQERCRSCERHLRQQEREEWS